MIKNFKISPKLIHILIAVFMFFFFTLTALSVRAEEGGILNKILKEVSDITNPVDDFLELDGINVDIENIRSFKNKSSQIKIIKNITYKESQKKPLFLDIYLPKNENPLPVILCVHGGAFLSGNKEDLDFMSKYLSKNGYAVISVNYTFTFEAFFPAQIDDIRDALAWIEKNAEKFNFDGDNIGAIGVSAGGHLVSLLGTSEGDEEAQNFSVFRKNKKVKAVVNMYGLTDLINFKKDCNGNCKFDKDEENPLEEKLIGCSMNDCYDNFLKASPVNYIDQNDAAFLSIHGFKDNIIPFKQSVRFHNLLKSSGVDTEVIIDKDFGHDKELINKYKNKIIEFFDRYLKES